MKLRMFSSGENVRSFVAWVTSFIFVIILISFQENNWERERKREKTRKLGKTKSIAQPYCRVICFRINKMLRFYIWNCSFDGAHFACWILQQFCNSRCTFSWSNSGQQKKKKIGMWCRFFPVWALLDICFFFALL